MIPQEYCCSSIAQFLHSNVCGVVDPSKVKRVSLLVASPRCFLPFFFLPFAVKGEKGNEKRIDGYRPYCVS